MSWKVQIEYKIAQASNYRKIGKDLKKLAKLLLAGSTRFDLVYSSSRDKYVNLIFRDTLEKDTARILLLNGYKQFYLNNK